MEVIINETEQACGASRDGRRRTRGRRLCSTRQSSGAESRRRDVGMVSEYFRIAARTCVFGCGTRNGELTAGILEPTLGRVSDLSEQVAMARLEQRLSDMYAGLAPDQIAAAVHDARAHFDQSPVRDFVPLLVERRVHVQLAEMSSQRVAERVAVPG
jgi:hypothetical protein